MRLLGVLIICLTLIGGTTYVFENRDELSVSAADRLLTLLRGDPSEIDAAPLGLEPENLENGRAIIAMRQAGNYTSLVGLPGVTRIAFDMPQTVTARSGEIVLELAGKLSADTAAVLRVSVNGSRRSAVLVNKGPINRTATVSLTARDLEAEELIVRLTVEGNALIAECTPRGPRGLVLQVLPSSHLDLNLEEPITDPRDKLLLAGAPARVSWPQSSTPDQELTLATAFRSTQDASDILFTPATSETPSLTLADIRALSGLSPAPTALDTIDPTDLAEALGKRRTEEFSRTASWRLPFDMNSFPGTAKAVAMALTFASAAQEDTPWLLSVHLNDRLIHAQRTDAGTGSVQEVLALPEELLGLKNVLLVTLKTSATPAGECRTRPPAIAELGTAQLITGQASALPPLFDLAQLVQDGAYISVPEALSLSDAQSALDTLKDLSDLGVRIPTKTAPATTDNIAEITVVKETDLEDFLNNRGDQAGAAWVAYRPSNGSSDIVTHPLTSQTETALSGRSQTVLVITEAAQKDRS